MKVIFKTTISLLVSLAFSYTGLSQSIFISYGPAYTTTKQVVPVVNGGRGDANTAYVLTISYEHFFPQKPIGLIAAYSKFDGYTFIYFEKGGVIEYGNEVGAVGFIGVKVNRIDVGLEYKLMRKKQKFYCTPYLAEGLQISKKTGDEIYSELAKLDGPNYFELEPIRSDPFNTVQFVPSIGVRTGFVFYKRLDIGFSIQGVLGHKAFQKMYLQYEYKGIPQKTGEFEANGTGLFVTLGIGYRFAKLIKN